MNQTNEAEVADMIGQELPRDVNATLMHNDNLQLKLSVVNLDRFSSYTKFLKDTRRVRAVGKEIFAITENASNKDMQDAEKLWVKEMQREYCRN